MYNTVKDLKAGEPALVSQIAAEAAAEATARERKRLQEIEQVAGTINDAELIREAKYGERCCSAAELALRAMQKQAQLRQ